GASREEDWAIVADDRSSAATQPLTKRTKNSASHALNGKRRSFMEVPFEQPNWCRRPYSTIAPGTNARAHPRAAHRRGLRRFERVLASPARGPRAETKENRRAAARSRLRAAIRLFRRD